MGAWGPGLWSDDTAADIRLTYREALEDGLDDDAATARVLTEFAPDLEDAYESPVVWLALAVAQHNLGRLTDDVKSRAIDVIDSGADLRRWDDAEPRIVAKRRAVLAKTRERLVGEQPPRKRIRKPARPVTDLVPGDVLGFWTESGRLHLLAVRARLDNRYGLSPIVELLDYQGSEIPDTMRLSTLKPRAKGQRASGARPADPWWKVDGVVMHHRGRDYADLGFKRVGLMSPPTEAEQRALSGDPSSFSDWDHWADYLQVQDVLLGDRLASTPARRRLFRRRHP